MILLTINNWESADDAMSVCAHSSLCLSRYSPLALSFGYYLFPWAAGKTHHRQKHHHHPQSLLPLREFLPVILQNLQDQHSQQMYQLILPNSLTLPGLRTIPMTRLLMDLPVVTTVFMPHTIGHCLTTFGPPACGWQEQWQAVICSSNEAKALQQVP